MVFSLGYLHVSLDSWYLPAMFLATFSTVACLPLSSSLDWMIGPKSSRRNRNKEELEFTTPWFSAWWINHYTKLVLNSFVDVHYLRYKSDWPRTAYQRDKENSFLLFTNFPDLCSPDTTCLLWDSKTCSNYLQLHCWRFNPELGSKEVTFIG